MRSQRHELAQHELSAPAARVKKIAQCEIAAALETADARRQRIIISQSQINLLKWHAGSCNGRGWNNPPSGSSTNL
jgi:hypothetical protein